MPVEQLTLDLFPAPSFEEVLTRDGITGLTVTLSRRRSSGWRVTEDRRTGTRELSVPASLSDASDKVKQALIVWARLPLHPRRGSSTWRTRQVLERTVWEYIRTSDKQPRPTPRFDPARFEGETRGVRFDLREIFDNVNRAHFEGRIIALVRWGAPGSTTSYQSVRTDREGRKHDVITIAGAYNHPETPEFALAAVMHHEMLHIAIPPVKRSSRRTVHGTDFRRAERAYPDHEKWRAWEREHLRRHARGVKRKRKRRGLFGWLG